MFFKKRKNMINDIKLNIYTKDTFLDIYPDKTVSDWEKCYRPYNIDRFLLLNLFSLAKNYDFSETSKISLYTIDDEYISWLKSNSLEHNTNNLQKYNNSISEQDCIRLSQKNNSLVQIDVKFLEIELKNKSQTGFYNGTKLNKDQIAALSSFLSDNYETSSIYLPGYIIPKDNVINEMPKIRNIGIAHFIDDIDVSIASYEKCVASAENTFSLFIPYENTFSLFIPYFTCKTLPPILSCNKIFKKKERSDTCITNKNLFDIMTKYFCYEGDLVVSKLNLIQRFTMYDKYVSLFDQS